MRRALVLLVLALLASGCTRFPGEDQGGFGGRDPLEPPPPVGPPLRFGGLARDVLTNEPIADAYVQIDLAQVLPCGRQGIGWSSWRPEMRGGAWGPFEVPRPRSDEVAFFVHAFAPGYARATTFVGSTQARGDIGNLTSLLHPDASVNGTAPPGTIVALAQPVFPRLALAGANGTFEFPQARAEDAAFVAATSVPHRAIVRPPAIVEVSNATERGWVLEGRLASPTGAPVAADIVAWNGTSLWSAARAGETGAFALPLPPEPVSLRIDARTSDGRLGGALAIDVKGPPALRETILMRALC